MTINDHWGYSGDDRNTKSVRRLVHVLARASGVGGNLLLNVGPTPEGEILPVQAERLRGRASGWRTTARRSTVPGWASSRGRASP